MQFFIFCLFDWWITFFKNICTVWYVPMEFKDVNWLCKHVKKVRSSQASISRNPCIELRKPQFFTASIVKGATVEVIFCTLLVCSHYFFNTVLSKSPFSTNYYRKKAFCLSVNSVFYVFSVRHEFWIWSHIYRITTFI